MNNLEWKLLASEYLYRDNWFTARRDRCERPDGKIIDPYYVLEYPNWVTALALTDDGKAILVRQYRHAYGQTILETPGGCIDATDASPEAAVRRELLEETGYTFSAVQPLGIVSANPSTNTNIMHLFLATGGQKTNAQALDENEEIEVLLYTLPELKQLLASNQLVQSMHVSCIFYGLIALGAMEKLV
jgi:8-oxo-dGTP pyrophosphatase MutT (NUDIX family)